jgi:plasmid stabilization system protein ParE
VEVVEAMAWYMEEGSVELGLRFTDELVRTLDKIAANPYAWTLVHPQIRRALVHGFPYAVLYKVEGELVEVLRVMHQRRHPSESQR